MFTTPTVFVLGAGVSQPFGFPSGQELIQRICGSPGGIQTAMKSMLEQATGESNKRVDEFFENLSQAQDSSIDRWLESNRAFMDLGKCAIAYVIAHAEHLMPMIPKEGLKKDWFHWLWNVLRTEDVTTLYENNVSFITFNYDRVLEYKLYQAVSHGYVQAPADEKEKAIEQLHARIIHVHGALSRGLRNVKTFGRVHLIERNVQVPNAINENANWIADYIEGIRIISENLDQTAGVSAAQAVLGKAKRVVFLGFGYEERNIARLDPLKYVRGLATIDQTVFDAYSLHNAPVIGSAMGMEFGEREFVARLTQRRLLLDKDGCDAVQFCRRNVVSDTRPPGVG